MKTQMDCFGNVFRKEVCKFMKVFSLDWDQWENLMRHVISYHVDKRFHCR